MPSLNVEKINDIIEHFNLNCDDYPVFVETGTYLGQTIENVQPYFNEVHTIEVSEYLYKRFFEEHSDYDNVNVYLGDSSKIIPELLEKIENNKRCIFWLDGHFSQGITSRGEKDVPLLEECSAIDKLYKADEGILLIDDYRLFGVKALEDWTEITVENIKKCFNNFELFEYIHPGDIFCLLIRRKISKNSEDILSNQKSKTRKKRKVQETE